ncbi:MAG TPA: hypothetical protein VM425_00320 [Myxococcota bacterium]|nr:hypothetical protein [Myxococcota bacterium]
MSKQPSSRPTALLSSCLLALTIAGAGCTHQGTPPDIRQARDILKITPVTPADYLGRGWARFVRGNDLRGALDDFTQAAKTLTAGKNKAQANLGAGLALLLQADFAAAGEAVLDAVEAAPGTPGGLAAAIQLREIVYQIPGGHERISARVRKLISGGQAGLECARALRLILLEGARRRGDWPATRAMEAEMGVVPLWRVGFPFGRHPLLDFDRAFLPQTGPLTTTRERPLSTRRADQGLLSIESYGRQGVAFAESFFEVRCQDSCKRDLALRIRSDEPWAAFLDDSPVAVYDSHRRRLPRVARMRFAVGPGWHRLLLKVPVSRAGTGLAAEMTGAGGEPAKVVWWDEAASLAGRAPVYRPGLLEKPTTILSAGDLAAGRAGVKDSNLLQYILAALLVWENGDPGQARDLLARALQRVPDSSLLHFLQGLLALEDDDLPPPIDRTISRENLARAVAACPQAALAEFRLMLLPGAEQDDEQALDVLTRLEANKPGRFLWPYFRGDLLSKLGWDQAAGSAYNRALGILPDNADLLRRMFQRALHAGSADRATQLAKRLEALGIFEGLADFWIAREREDRAQEILEAAVHANPARLENTLALCDLLAGQSHAGDALKLIDEASLLATRDPRLLDRRANLLDVLGRRDEAQATLVARVAFAPWDLAARRAADAAAGSSHIRLVGEERIDAKDLIEEFLKSQTVVQGDSALVLDQTSIEIGRDGSSVARTHTIARVLTPAGLERWGEIDPPASGANLEKLRTIKADGRIFDAEAIPGKDSISLKQLQIGDFVEIEALSGSPSTGPVDGSGSWLGKRWYFRAPATSVFRSLYSVALPRGAKLEIDAHGKTPAPAVRDQGDFEIAVFREHDLPLIAPEPDAVPLDEYAPFIQLGFGTNWSDLRDILRIGLDKACLPAPELKRALSQIAGKGDPQERLRRVFHWVTRNIRQAGEFANFGEPAPHILLRREGNRLILLAALVREMGLSPRVYLARTSTDSHVDYRFPNPGTYRHGLLAVTTGGHTFWMDPGARFNAFDVLYPFVAGGQAVEATSSAGAGPFARLPASHGQPLIRSIRLEMTLAASGDLSGRGTESIPTAQAPAFRALLSSFSPNRRRQALEAGLGNYFSGARLESYKIRNLANPDLPLVIEYDLNVPGFAHLQAGSLVIREGFYPYRLGQGLAHSQSRSLPLMIGAETRTATSVVLRLPKGARPQLPPPADFAAPLSKFSYRSGAQDDLMTIEKTLLVKAGRVAPADYPAFRDFCRRVDTIDDREIVINLSGGV